LRETGVPLTSSIDPESKSKIWKCAKSDDELPFKARSAAAVIIGTTFLREFAAKSILGKGATEASSIASEYLPSVEKKNLGKLLSKVSVLPYGWCDYNAKPEILDTLFEGLMTQTAVKIKYKSRHTARPEQYTIHPYLLLIRDGVLYLAGYSSKSKTVRTWKIDRMKDVQHTGEEFSVPESFDNDVFNLNSFAIYSDSSQEPVKVRVKIAKAGAEYAQEHFWHDTQEFEKQKDGSVVVEFTSPLVRGLVIWIMRFGKNAEVLEPKELRQTIADEIAAMAKLY
jgi:proteasome accessory factor B